MESPLPPSLHSEQVIEKFLCEIFLQVIHACSVGQYEHGPSFGRFDCTFHDVCSRVYHLVKDGYIAHSPSNQQILVYMPDIEDPTERVSL